MLVSNLFQHLIYNHWLILRNANHTSSNLYIIVKLIFSTNIKFKEKDSAHPNIYTTNLVITVIDRQSYMKRPPLQL